LLITDNKEKIKQSDEPDDNTVRFMCKPVDFFDRDLIDFVEYLPT